jgi:hypothetical protein
MGVGIYWRLNVGDIGRLWRASLEARHGFIGATRYGACPGASQSRDSARESRRLSRQP